MPEPGLFRHVGTFQRVIGQCEQIVGAIGLEVGNEGTELVAEHSLRQTNFARFVISRVGLIVPFKINEVASQVKPGERVGGVFLGGGLGDVQRVLPISHPGPSPSRAGS